MADTLLTTKLYIPPFRADLVSRPHLVSRLNAALGPDGHFIRKLTLVSAPAGFGKTTLLSEWVSQHIDPVVYPVASLGKEPSVHDPQSIIRNLQVAWLSLDEADNEADRFLLHLIAALQTIRAGIGEAATAVLQSPQQPSVQAILTSLVNELTTDARPLVLVLDDYHVIEAKGIDGAMAFLLEHQPPNLHLVVAGRADPFLPLSRLRARGQMTELRTEDLRFSPQEAAIFLNNVMGLGLSGADLAALESRTEGWITGLHLAALSMQDRKRRGQDPASFIQAFAGDDRYIVDYLVDEVLAQRPQGTQDFLLRTSILDRMTGPLCDAVRLGSVELPTSQESGQETLERLDQANLFVVPLDSQRRWYRYHHLFADLLRHRLRAKHPDLIPELYQRASAWYETEDEIEAAIRYALRAKDDERAARLLDAVATTLVATSEFRALLRWIDALPEMMCHRFPRICLAHAWVLQFTYRLEAVEPVLALAEAAAESSTYPERLISANARAIRAYVARERGEYARSLELTHSVLDLLADDSSDDTPLLRGAAVLNLGLVHILEGRVAAAGETLQQAVELNRAAQSPFAMLSSVTHLMRVRISQGQLHQAEALGQQGLGCVAEWRAEGATRSGASAREVHQDMSRVLYEWNDLVKAAHHVRRATELEELGLVGQPVASYIMCAYVQQAQGNVDGALDYLQRIESYKATQRQSRIAPRIMSQIVQLELLLYRLRPDQAFLLAEASRWAAEAGIDPGDDLSYGREHRYATLARLLLAQGRYAEVLPLLKRLCHAAESASRNGDLVKYLIWRSLTHQALMQPNPAHSSLNQALVLAQPEGYVRSFVDEGEPMAELLGEAAFQGISPAYCRRLLSAFGEPEQSQQPTPKAERSSLVPRPSSSLVEPLSERELQILQLLRTELSGPEIAHELVVSVSTVRYHTRNIYGKFGVHTRRQAIMRAERLGLL
ncbi:LuxR C-terminal-related transcriptional regulator [Chloroflexota bacterium]